MTMKTVAVVAVALVAAISMAQGQGRGAGRQGFGGNQNTLMGLLNRPDVQTELKVTDDQKGKLNELRPQRGQGGGRGAGGGGGQGAPDPQAMRAQQAEREKKMFEILDANQAKRLKELFVQRAGNRAVMHDEIAKAVGITETQTTQFRELQRKQRDAMTSVREKIQSGELDRAQMRDLMSKNEKVMDEEMGKILTAEQKDKLKAMRGAEFKFQDEVEN